MIRDTQGRGVSTVALRVAIVHDYLTQRGGAERVVLSMLREFPDARLVTSVYEPESTYREFRKYPVETLWVDRLSPLRKDPRRALPLLAKAFSSLRISDVDVVISSSSGWAHGVSTDAPKIVYCHNPARWLHQSEDYVAEHRLPVRVALEALRGPLTRWDHRAASSATKYLANSTAVRDRVRRTYGIDAEVLHPSVGINPGGPQDPVVGVQPGFLLSVSRQRAYKNAELVARAVEQLPGERLVLVGGLPEPSDGHAWSERIIGLSGVSDAQLRWLYAHCAGLVAVGHEDFGLTPLEANVFGKPVVCLRAGGYLDTVVDGQTGVLVDRLAPDDIADGIRRLCATRWDVPALQDHAEAFSTASFGGRLREIAERVLGRAPRTPVIELPTVTEDFPLESSARAAR